MRGFIALLCVLGVVGASGCYEVRDPKPYAPNKYAIEANNAAVEALQAGRYRQALAKATKALDYDSAFREAYLAKAAALSHLGRAKKGVSALESALEQWPDDPDVLLFHGILLEKTGELANAKKSYQAAAEALDDVRPQTSTTMLNHAIATYLGHGRAPGLQEINMVVAKYPGNQSAKQVRDKIQAGEREYFQEWMPGARGRRNRQ